MKNNQLEHKITSGLTGVVISGLMLAAVGGLAIWMHIRQNNAFLLISVLVVFIAIAFVLALYRALFFKVLIDKNGFFYQTAPGNGTYYPYGEIEKLWVSPGQGAGAQASAYCNFETKGGKVFKFPFMGIDSDAVDYLLEQMDAGGTDHGEV